MQHSQLGAVLQGGRISDHSSSPGYELVGGRVSHTYENEQKDLFS